MGQIAKRGAIWQFGLKMAGISHGQNGKLAVSRPEEGGEATDDESTDWP
ncbi:hypothetical protein SB748_09260 [Rhizobium sp. SIMBA_035]